MVEIIVVGAVLMVGISAAATISMWGQSDAEGDDRLTRLAKALHSEPRYEAGELAVPLVRPEGDVWVRYGRGFHEPHLQYMDLRIVLAAHLPSLEVRPKVESLGGGTDFEGRFTVSKVQLGALSLILEPELRQHLVTLSLRQDTWQGAVSLLVRGYRPGQPGADPERGLGG